jgi:hypothetical protein
MPYRRIVALAEAVAVVAAKGSRDETGMAELIAVLRCGGAVILVVLRRADDSIVIATCLVLAELAWRRVPRARRRSLLIPRRGRGRWSILRERSACARQQGKR